MEGLENILLRHSFFQGFEKELAPVVSGCARNLRFAVDAHLFHEGDPADEFYLIREGAVALEISAPGQAAKIFLTLGEGELTGLSWLVPPYRWTFDARVTKPLRAIGIDARCLRTKCDSDPRLGYEMMKRLAVLLVKRLHATRLQVLDVYGRTES
jgi:CRP/FNR family cyclic AMP-dependent transcriptional regulator